MQMKELHKAKKISRILHVGKGVTLCLGLRITTAMLVAYATEQKLLEGVNICKWEGLNLHIRRRRRGYTRRREGVSPPGHPRCPMR